LIQAGSITKWLSIPIAHISTATVIATGMLGALGVMLRMHDQRIIDIVLLVAIAAASLPLLISLVQRVLKGQFSVDLLAFLSIVTSLILGQYWVAAIVVLMLSGGQALESYATGRASSVLRALAKRMPQPQIQRLGRPSWHLVHTDCCRDCTCKLVLQRRVWAFSRRTCNCNAMPALDINSCRDHRRNLRRRTIRHYHQGFIYPGKDGIVSCSDCRQNGNAHLRETEPDASQLRWKHLETDGSAICS
jgi:hypothetical protein